MIVIIFSLVVALLMYLENLGVHHDYTEVRKRQLCTIFSLSVITFLGVLPKIICEQYEIVYIFQYSMLLMILIVIAKIDFEKKIIPNEIVLLILTINSLFLVLEMQSNLTDSRLIISSALLGFLSGGVIFIMVNLLQKNGVGAGDIKLFAVLGIPLGFVGIVSICLNTFIFAAVTSLVLLRLKKINLGGRIALAPFIFLAVLLYS